MNYCAYCADLPPDNPHRRYHDHEYGFPLADDNRLFERLVLEINQAGLSWETILRKADNLHRAYNGFDIATVAAYGEADTARLLADPGIIGVSSGASVGAVLAIGIGVTAGSVLTLPAFAFTGAILAVGLTVSLSMRRGRIPVMTLLLSGVVVGMFLAACTAAILTVMNEQKMQQYLFWTIGGLDYRRWDHVLLGIGPIGIGMSIMVLLARHLNLLAFGEVEARAAGMPVTAFRLLFLVLASLTTAAGVCISGNIGFVGLVVPHMVRLLIGPDHRRLLPASLLAGAVFLVLCDSLGRILLHGMEIRVGIMTAFIGTPYFLYLLRRHMKTAV